MADYTKHQPGTFCWNELGTTDPDGAKKFYTSLFGWTTRDVPMGDYGTYYMWQKNGQDAGAMYKQDPEQQQQGIPPNWAQYVAVTDADASADKAKQLGGNVVAGPFDVFDSGRMAMVVDPTGAVFGMWQAKQHIGHTVANEFDAFTWNEILTPDPKKAKEFYTSLFGWTAKESPGYTEWHLGEQAIGGMLDTSGPEFGGQVPPVWLPYVSVKEIEETLAKAKELGATVKMGPETIDHVGTFALLSDPQGAVFYVIQLNR